MDWLINLFTTQDSVAHIALLYSIVIAVGVLLGKVKIGGISLGVTFVLFAGIVAGHIGFTAPTDIDSLCFLYRSTSRPWILREFPQGRRCAERACHSHDFTQHPRDVQLLLSVLRHRQQAEPAHDGRNVIRCRDQHAGSGCSQRGVDQRLSKGQCAPDCFGICLCLSAGRAGNHRRDDSHPLHLPCQAGE